MSSTNIIYFQNLNQDVQRIVLENLGVTSLKAVTLTCKKFRTMADKIINDKFFGGLRDLTTNGNIKVLLYVLLKSKFSEYAVEGFEPTLGLLLYGISFRNKTKNSEIIYVCERKRESYVRSLADKIFADGELKIMSQNDAFTSCLKSQKKQLILNETGKMTLIPDAEVLNLSLTFAPSFGHWNIKTLPRKIYTNDCKIFLGKTNIEIITFEEIEKDESVVLADARDARKVSRKLGNKGRFMELKCFAAARSCGFKVPIVCCPAEKMYKLGKIDIYVLSQFEEFKSVWLSVIYLLEHNKNLKVVVSSFTE